MDECIFCKIINGEIPSFKLYEDEKCVVILDAFPATKGQSLVVPKEHKKYIFDVGDELYKHLFLVAKKVAKATDKALGTVRSCLVVEGFGVDHIHVRLHPCYEKKLKLEIGERLGEEGEEIKKEIQRFLKQE